jgi:hypothetical protein
MTITIQPITVAERPRCAWCGEGMRPSGRCTNALTWKTEEEFAAASTNRRVYSVKRSWHKRWNDDGNTWERGALYHIAASVFPIDERDWGYDGTFCTIEHARQFAHAAIRAGYRVREKEKTA